MQAAFVALGQELGFVGGHIHLHGALGFAGLATEAEVEGVVDGAALEAFFAQRAGEHLPEQAGAAAGGVLLFAGGAIAGAHDAALGFAAGADADTALGGALEEPFGGENEVGFESVRCADGALRWGPGSGSRAVAQIFDRIVDTHGIDELAGIHAVVGIPDGLEFAEGLISSGPNILGKQSGAGLAVAVFAGERAAEAEHDIGGAVDELAEVAQALCGAEVEVDAQCGRSPGRSGRRAGCGSRTRP